MERKDLARARAHGEAVRQEGRIVTRQRDEDDEGPALKAKSKTKPKPNERRGWRTLSQSSPVPTLLPPLMISMLSGASHVGKTVYIASLIKRLQEGKTIFGFPSTPPPFIGLVVTDRRWETARYWFDVAGVKESKTFQAYCLLDDSTFDWRDARREAAHAQLFVDAMDALEAPPGSLLIYDPIALYLGRRLNDYSETAAVIGELNVACIKRGVTVLGTCHVAKLRGDKESKVLRPQDRALGSTAISAYTNTQFYIMGREETEKDHWLIGYTSHESPAREFKFIRDEKGLFIPLSAEAREALDAAETLKNVEDDPIYRNIPEPAEEPVAAKRLVQLGSMYDTSRATVFRKLKVWKDAGLVEQIEKGWRRKAGGN
jgi:hypothetical protein